MGSTKDLNLEITFYNNDVKIYRNVVNAMLPNIFNVIEAYFLDDNDYQNLYTKMEVKYGGKVIIERNVKTTGIKYYG